MPVSTLPIAAVVPGNVLTSTNWNAIVKDNLNKLLNQGHRVLTVAQFGALTGLEGTKGTVAPDEVYLEVDSTNGIQWHLAYESGEPTYKWRFIGGPPMVATVATVETPGSSATWLDLTTVGPQITAPRGGDYEANAVTACANGSGGGGTAEMGTVVTGSTVPNRIGVVAWSAVSLGGGIAMGESFPGRTAGDVFKMRYWHNSIVSATFSNRRLAVYPNRLI